LSNFVNYLYAFFQVNILKYWKDQSGSLPNLAKMARDWLCVPMTSTSSERMFSSSGNIVSPARTNLAPDTLSKLIFIQQNFTNIKVREWNLVSSVDAATVPTLMDPETRQLVGLFPGSRTSSMTSLGQLVPTESQETIVVDPTQLDYEILSDDDDDIVEEY
jgi:hypothetical protein